MTPRIQSPIENRKSPIENRQSPIENRKSPIENRRCFLIGLLLLVAPAVQGETVVFSDNFESVPVAGGNGNNWIPQGSPNVAFETTTLTDADGNETNSALVFTGTQGIQRAAVRSNPDVAQLKADSKHVRLTVRYRVANPGDEIRIILSENESAEGAIVAELAPVGMGSGRLSLLRIQSAEGWGPTAVDKVPMTSLATLPFEDNKYFQQIDEWNEFSLEIEIRDGVTHYSAEWRSVNKQNSAPLTLEFSDSSAQRLSRPFYVLLSAYRGGGAPGIAFDNVTLETL